SVYFTINLKL
ncbi:hypothetical protein CFOL_v3_19469, partial [Cephalotus follicularis]